MKTAPQSAREWIRLLDLKPHPEGGHYRESYRSPEKVQSGAGENRSASTLIYYLLEGREFSALHRIVSDEVWHFYDGSTLRIPIFKPDGSFEEIRLGRNVENGEILQAVVPAGSWFGAYVQDLASFVLSGCSVSPGFEFKDLEFAREEELIKKYPAHSDKVRELVRRQHA